MLDNIKKRSLSLALINARITDKSFKKWKMFGFCAKKIFQKFDICLSANLKSKNFLKSLGAKNIKYIGNLKFSQIENSRTNLNKDIKKFFMKKKIWCASSTHYSEEKICAETHKKLKSKYKNLLTIIIPRHVHRSNEIKNEIQKLNLKVHMHDSKKKIDPQTDIYLVNSFGQTSSFFKICKTVFLGGSIIKHGGQNPLEAVRYGCNVIHGQNIWNFEEIYSLLKKYEVSNKIMNSGQLTTKIDNTLNMQTNSKNIKIKIKLLGDKILNSTFNEIDYFINQ